MSRRVLWCLALPVALALVGGLSCRPAGGSPRAIGPTDFRPHPFDWPQWQGPDRTAVSKETGLLQSWPKGGPPLAWSVDDVGGGYSTPAIAAGRIFGMGYIGNDEVVWALNEVNGAMLWKTRIATANRSVGYGEGSRCTPTVDGDVLYALGVSGDLVCLGVEDGKERWHRLLRGDKDKDKDLGGAPGSWGYTESPLVDGDRLLITPGGAKATVAALDKKTGETVWTAKVPGGDAAGYSSIVAADFNGQREYIQFLSGGVVGLTAEGKFLWRYTKPSAGINCMTPIYHDGEVYAAAEYGKGGGAVKLTKDGDGVKATELYFSSHFQNHHGGMVLVDGYLYGEGTAQLACVEFKTGKEMWRDRQAGKGSITYADGRLYYRNEGGPLLLVEANPKKYVECGRLEPAKQTGKSAWPHPVISNGRLYVRDQELLFCYDVKKP
jgi:outer membrane protein assembly factor BamB